MEVAGGIKVVEVSPPWERVTTKSLSADIHPRSHQLTYTNPVTC
jgi:hypothetical protein